MPDAIHSAGAKKLGLEVGSEAFFDTVCINVGDARKVVDAALQAELNVRMLNDSQITVSFDETTTIADVDALFKVLNKGQQPDFSAESLASEVSCCHYHASCQFAYCRQTFARLWCSGCFINSPCPLL